MKRICELNTKIFARIWHHLAMSKVLQWTELSLIFFAQAAADIESRALLGLIILSLCLDKSRKIQCLRADAVFKCFQLSSFDMFRNHLEHFLKATLANSSRQCWALWCSLGCCGCGEYFVVFFFFRLVVVVVVLFLLIIIIYSSASSSSSSMFLLSQTPKLHPFRVFFGTDFDKTLIHAMFC